MSNATNGFGFRNTGRITGTSPTFGMRQYPILYTNTTSIGRGDPVTLSGNGYIYQATSGDSPILGVFDGCTYTDTSQISPVVNANAWTGASTAVSGSVYGYVIDDPGSTFWVRASNGPVSFADVGANVTFIVSAPDSSGLSTMLLNATVSTTNTYPFRVVSVTEVPINNDSSTSGNIVMVKGNSWLNGTTTGTV